MRSLLLFLAVLLPGLPAAPAPRPPRTATAAIPAAPRAAAAGAAGLPSSADCVEAFLEQPLDHGAAPATTSTFRQRYFYNASFFRRGGPVFYYTGNEADVTLYVNATGLMWENAAAFGALLVFGEHRFYGRSVPAGGPSPANLPYLSEEQALADHAALVAHVKSALVPGAAQSPVIAFGGSYGGMLSAWARMTYPDTFWGAIAGSAPILAFDADVEATAKVPGPDSYWSIVTADATAAAGSAPGCAADVARSWAVMDRLVARGPRGLATLGSTLRMCTPPTGAADVDALKLYLAVAWDTMAMGNFPFPSSYLASGKAVLPAFPVRAACALVADRHAAAAAAAAAAADDDDDLALVAAVGRAAAIYNNATQDQPCFTLPDDPDYDGIWDYLWCTETLPQETYFGRDGVHDMFWPFAYNETAIDAHCQAKYGVSPAYRRIHDLYGGVAGVRENASHVVFSNGRFDPWRSGGVVDVNVSEHSTWSIIIPSGAHHVDLMFSTADDPPDITAARAFELSKVKEWIAAFPKRTSSPSSPPPPPSSAPRPTAATNDDGPSSSSVFPDIRTVHVINSCHLDIGFADSSAGIINRYFDHHIPMAVRVGNELRATAAEHTTAPGPDRLNFMFQSWVLSFYLDCPPNMGLHCPSPEAVTNVTRAIQLGDITWHAFPHNAQLEVMGGALVTAGLALTHALDDRFDLPSKATLSQRDVPGIPRSAIPFLNRSGISAVSIGANDGSTPPDVPPCFLWEDTASGTSLLGLFTWPGYGEMPLTHQTMCKVDGLTHALVYNWNGDNAGPWEASRYRNTWASLAESFPNANIVASTFDNFTQHLSAVRDKLPVVQSDIGDTWVYGVPSDPQVRLKKNKKIHAPPPHCARVRADDQN